MKRFAILALLVINSFAAFVSAELKAPEGFSVGEFAGANLANDIQCITLDRQGRIVVAGRGYIRILVDDDGDGRADRAIAFAEGADVQAMGLMCEGEHLYYTGNGGLRRFHTVDGDHADGPSSLIRKVKADGEHDAHAIRRGPDEWLYLLCGNSAGVDASWAGPKSPIRSPVAGCLVRFSPDFKTSEVVCDGFRNPYDFDFNRDGEPFTFDSDNERCVSLPWYEGCRFYHLISGGHYGWQSPQRGDFWRMPPYFFDVVPPIADLGRGSPTGVICYRHMQFPERYRGGFFLLDWTFGKIYFIPLHREGAAYAGSPEVFLRPEGDDGFAPVGGVVDPKTGDLFVAIGGRGTRGAVYRIRYSKGLRKFAPVEVAAMQPTMRSLETPRFDDVIVLATAGSADERRRALAELQRRSTEASPSQHRAAIVANWGNPDRTLRQATARLIGRLPQELLGELAHRVTLDVFHLWYDDKGAITGPQASSANSKNLAGSREWLTFLIGRLSVARALSTFDEQATAGVAIMARAESASGLGDAQDRLDFIRLQQLLSRRLPSKLWRGTVWEGYDGAVSEALNSDRRVMFRSWLINNEAYLAPESALAPQVTYGLRRGSRSPIAAETARLFALLELTEYSAEERTRIAASLFSNITVGSDPVDDIHYLICLSRFPTLNSDLALRTAAALLALDEKLAARGYATDSNWPRRIRELHEELARKLPDLNSQILAHPSFGRSDHTLFALAPSFKPLRAKAAEIILKKLDREPDPRWTPEIVRLLAELPFERIAPLARSRWDELGLREEILSLLARQPDIADRAKFLDGLSSPSVAQVARSLVALERLPPGCDGDMARVVLRAYDQAPAGLPGDAIRKSVLRVLRHATGIARTGDERKQWGEWLQKHHPEQAAKLFGRGVDWPQWERRLSQVDWSAGEPGRGREVFTKSACLSCHSGGRALGPDLKGAASRFSRNDLFIAICDPSRDVPVRYQTTLVATTDGRVYQGLVVYEAADGLILQIGPDKTIRLGRGEVVQRTLQRTSLMPNGLLDKATARDLTDLYAYLKSLH